jgi:hypothetical protein
MQAANQRHPSSAPPKCPAYLENVRGRASPAWAETWGLRLHAMTWRMKQKSLLPLFTYE